MASATPFRDFTKRGARAHNLGMGDKATQKQIQDARRAKLIAYISEHFPSATHPRGNVSAFADGIGKKQSQIADVLDGRKPFGEKLAINIEQLVTAKLVPKGKPELRFDIGRDAVQTFYGIPLSREAVEFAAEWTRLRGPVRGVVRDLVRTGAKDREPKKAPADVRDRLQRRKDS